MGTAVTINYSNDVTYLGEVKENQPWGRGKVSFGSGTWIQADFAEGKMKKGKMSSE